MTAFIQKFCRYASKVGRPKFKPCFEGKQEKKFSLQVFIVWCKTNSRRQLQKDEREIMHREKNNRSKTKVVKVTLKIVQPAPKLANSGRLRRRFPRYLCSERSPAQVRLCGAKNKSCRQIRRQAAELLKPRDSKLKITVLCFLKWVLPLCPDFNVFTSDKMQHYRLLSEQEQLKVVWKHSLTHSTGFRCNHMFFWKIKNN